MKSRIQRLSTLCITSLITGAVLLGSAMPSLADDRSRYRDKDRYEHRRHDDGHNRHVIRRGYRYDWPRKRVRHYRQITIVRPHGHWYAGFGHYHLDDEAYPWLAFTAITLKILDNLNEQQQREHESAQVRATTAPIGERIIWNDGSASGSVTATRDGTSTSGRYCREFYQEVIIGGNKEQAYGTACRQPDGTWEVISTEQP